MTHTELKYIVAVAREKHFGRAAEACFVSQPTLSVSIKKLEEELDVKLFERSANEVAVTALGEEIIRQAQSVLEQAANIKEIAKRGKDPLAGPLKLGVIYTIGPYLLPSLVRQAISKTPQMPLMLQEHFTVKLLEMLRTGEIDCAIMAEPFPDTGLATAPLYDEPFMAAVPSNHALATLTQVSADALKNEMGATTGITKYGELTLKVPYDPDLHDKIIDQWPKWCGEPIDISVQPIKVCPEQKPDGKMRVYLNCKPAGIKPPDMKRGGNATAYLELKFLPSGFKLS
jgi:hypothetical protein